LKHQNFYNKPFFETSHLGENVKTFAKAKHNQNVGISLGYFVFPNNHHKCGPICKKIIQSGHPNTIFEHSLLLIHTTHEHLVISMSKADVISSDLSFQDKLSYSPPNLSHFLRHIM
jgi:hypothetical protein